ncbi:MAG: 3-oxoacyl-ACP synthase III [Planctomycetes bacterium]|nr:3-oxoacyl-ACP synthase III [Planctomycetota bacterium]
MQYQHVCLEAFGYQLPGEILTTAEIEARLEPVYRRLRLPAGRLELMTGIRERRFWSRETMPSSPSVTSAEQAIAAAGIDRRKIGALLHASVCRDYLEPATAAGVHNRLGLSSDCQVYDVSNACLGILNGMVQIANMIELGQIQAGLVCGTESSRALVENTIDTLNNDLTLTRESIKSAVASLTIGSASAAVLLVHRSLSRTQNRLTAAVARAATTGHELCRSGRDESIGGDALPLMNTDSERLLRDGVAAAVPAFAAFQAATGWSASEIDKTICHQVGAAHRKLMFESLGLSPDIDFATFETLGNTGSVAVPMTAAMAVERGHLKRGDHVALMGIGSGINVLMLGVDWQTAPVVVRETASVPHARTTRLPTAGSAS